MNTLQEEYEKETRRPEYCEHIENVLYHPSLLPEDCEKWFFDKRNKFVDWNVGAIIKKLLDGLFIGVIK